MSEVSIVLKREVAIQNIAPLITESKSVQFIQTGVGKSPLAPHRIAGDTTEHISNRLTLIRSQ